MRGHFHRAGAAGLLNRGAFRPATSPAGVVKSYEKTRTTGALIHVGLETFWKAPWNQLLNRNGLDPPPRSVFTMQNVDWRANLAPLKAMGFDYVAITVHAEAGLTLFSPRFHNPFTTQSIVNTRSTGFPAPFFVHEHYAVQDWTSEMNYVDKFVVACQEIGITYGLYGPNMLASFPDANGYLTQAALPASLVEDIIQHRCLLAQEMILRWKPDFLWVDCASGFGVPAGAMRRLYSAIKSADPTCIVVGNNLGNAANGRDSYDAASQELNLNAAPQPAYYTDPTDGVQYYLEREFVHSVWDGGRWYYHDSQVEFIEGQRENLYYANISEWQTHVNTAKQLGIPFLTGFGLTRDGNLPPGLLNFLNQIDFRR